MRKRSIGRRIRSLACPLLGFALLVGQLGGVGRAAPPPGTIFFADEFNGGSIDAANWNTSLATSGLRWCASTSDQLGGTGNWQDPNTQACHGLMQAPPYGGIAVAGGLASFSAGAGRTFPYIWRGPPSKSSAIPSSGDFIIHVRMKVDSVQPNGTFLLVRDSPNSEPLGNNPPGTGGIFSINAQFDGVSTGLIGQPSMPVPGDRLAFHEYRLEYIGGQYSVFVDGVQTMGPVQSARRPNAIWIGNPVFTHWAFTNWSGFTLDFLRVHTLVVPNTTKLTYDGATTSDFNDAATVAATLTDGAGNPVRGTIGFILNGAETCSAMTDTTGRASCSLTPREAAGTYSLTASFAGNASWQASSTTASFSVTKEETALTYTGDTRVANGTPALMSGVLKEDGTTPIRGRSVSFTLGSGTSAQTCSATTDAAGSAGCSIASVSQPAAATSIPVTAGFAGDAFYLAASASATLRLEFMTGRSYGAAGSVVIPRESITLAPTPDTGAVSTASGGTTSTPCTAAISGVVTARTLCPNVTTGVAPGTSTANATVEDVTINTGIPGVPIIKATVIKASSQSTCRGASGTTTIATLTIDGVAQATSSGTILLSGPPGAKLMVNEQKAVPGAAFGLTVNALHLIVPASGGVSADVVVASATSDIHNCS